MEMTRKKYEKLAEGITRMFMIFTLLGAASVISLLVI